MEKKLSIILVSEEYPEQNGDTCGGGISTVYYELAHGLADLGHDVWVITHTYNEEKQYLEGNVHVWKVKSYKILHLMKEGTKPLNIKCRSRAVLDAIISLLKIKSFDIIQFPEISGEGYYFYRIQNSLKGKEKLKEMKIEKRFRQMKSIVRFHSSTKPYRKLHNMLDEDDRIMMDMEKYMIQNCDWVVSPCRTTVEAIKSAMGLNYFPVTYIPNPIDCSLFVPKAKEKNKDAFIFGFVGKIRYIKGADTLIEAFAEIAKAEDNVELHIVGRDEYMKKEGCYYSELITKELPENIKKRITIIDHVPRNQLVSYYQNFDAFVFTSRDENFPNVLVEAMSCGLPVIASSVGGVPELLGIDNPSIQFEGGDSKGLANALFKLLKDSKLRDEARIYNRKRIENYFARQIVANEYLKVYNKLLSE